MGSISISFTWAGVALYKRLVIIELIQTLLPEPVAPAINRCGIAARSTTTGFPAMSFPRATVILEALFLKRLLSIISLRDTGTVSLLGSSSPMADFPGMGASILTEVAAMLRAMSSERASILLTFTPGLGCSSYRVMEGPTLTCTTFASTPKVLRVSSNFLALDRSSLRLPDFLFSYSSRRLTGGRRYPGYSFTIFILWKPVSSISAAAAVSEAVL